MSAQLSSVLWFDVEERYNATAFAKLICAAVLWFDVEERYNATYPPFV